MYVLLFVYEDKFHRMYFKPIRVGKSPIDEGIRTGLWHASFPIRPFRPSYREKSRYEKETLYINISKYFLNCSDRQF